MIFPDRLAGHVPRCGLPTRPQPTINTLGSPVYSSSGIDVLNGLNARSGESVAPNPSRHEPTSFLKPG
jgi:hypothetical protein